MAEFDLVAQIPVSNQLGEGVIWDDQLDCFWWSDILSNKLYQWSFDGQLVEFSTPEALCSFGITVHQGWLVAAFASGFYWYNPTTGERRLIEEIEGDLKYNRMNDGRVDGKGRFWAGTMRMSGSGTLGALYRLDHRGAQPCLDQIEISNGLTWGLNGEWIYHADSPTRLIKRAPFDLPTGEIGEWTEWVHTEPGAYPDGACVDQLGGYWSAQWGSHRVCRYDETGQLTDGLTLPCKQPSCVAFGGKDLTLLCITSARESISQEYLQSNNGDGDVFIYQTSYVGLPENRCRLPLYENHKITTIGT